MAAGVTVRRNFVRVRDIQFVTAADMREVGNLVVNMIRQRTQQGKDADGQPFAPYHPLYAKQRERFAFSGSRVNLNVSGAMLDALSVEDVTDTTVRVGFSKGTT